jgi:hypothetical protein
VVWQQRLDRRNFVRNIGLGGAAALGLSALDLRDTLASPDAGRAGSRPGAAPVAAPDAAFDTMFANYGNNTDPSIVRWTGADSAYSVRLPDGRTVWIFSDTFLGYVTLDPTRGVYTRLPSGPFVHNSYVIQDAFRMSLSATLYGGTTAAPTSLVSPAANDGTWYWMGDATVEWPFLRQFVVHWKSTGSGPFDFAQVGTDIATFSLPDLRLLRIDPTPNGNGYYIIQSTGIGVSYAAAIREDFGYTYLYGVEDGGFTKWLHLARARAGRILEQWEFWTGSGWSADPQQTTRLLSNGVALDNLANEIGVSLTFPHTYNLIDQDFSFGNDILLYTAPAASGPWTRQGTVYTATETAFYQALGYGTNVYPYNAKSHEEFSTFGSTLLSYNVNSFNPPDVYTDASIYRPRFLRLTGI